MTQSYTTAIHKEARWFVAECIELGVASQGRTPDEARKNLQEAVELYLESFDGEQVGDPAREASLAGICEEHSQPQANVRWPQDARAGKARRS